MSARPSLLALLDSTVPRCRSACRCLGDRPAGLFPLYLLGDGEPPKGAIAGALHSISNTLPSPIPGTADPWLGLSSLGTQLAVFAAWAAAALVAIGWVTRRRRVIASARSAGVADRSLVSSSGTGSSPACETRRIGAGTSSR